MRSRGCFDVFKLAVDVGFCDVVVGHKVNACFAVAHNLDHNADFVIRVRVKREAVGHVAYAHRFFRKTFNVRGIDEQVRVAARINAECFNVFFFAFKRCGFERVDRNAEFRCKVRKKRVAIYVDDARNCLVFLAFKRPAGRYAERSALEFAFFVYAAVLEELRIGVVVFLELTVGERFA